MKTLPMLVLLGAGGFLSTACGPSVECAECAQGQDSPTGADGPGPAGSSGSGATAGAGAAPGTTSASSTSASTGASAGVTSGSGSAASYAPTQGVACNLSEKAWMGYVIPTEAMALGAGDPGGPGFCQGWVWFQPGWFQGTTYDADTGDYVQVQANGSTDLGGGCSASHCGTLFYSDGKAQKKYCSVFAACESGVAHTVGFNW